MPDAMPDQKLRPWRLAASCGVFGWHQHQECCLSVRDRVKEMCVIASLCEMIVFSSMADCYNNG